MRQTGKQIRVLECYGIYERPVGGFSSQSGPSPTVVGVGVGRQEKYLRSRNNGLFSAAPPGLRDRPVGWRPALPCPDHLQHGLLQPSPALGAPSSPPQLRTHSWIHGSIYFILTEAGPLWWMRGLYKHDLLCVMDAEMEEESPSHWPVAPACCL